MDEYVKTSVHALLAARRSEASSVAGAVDNLLGGAPAGSPMETEILEPLVAAAAQIALLREGRLGSLTQDQRQALNLVHGRLSQVMLLLREMHETPAAEPETATVN